MHAVKTVAIAAFRDLSPVLMSESAATEPSA